MPIFVLGILQIPVNVFCERVEEIQKFASPIITEFYPKFVFQLMS
jgi:hypothetical protein